MQFDAHIRNAEAHLREVEQAIAAFDFGKAGNDARNYQKLNREYQRLTRLMEAWQRFCKLGKDLADNRDLLASEKDEEFQAVIRADIEKTDAEIARLDREIKSLILPPDPNQGRSIIIEIRPAAGGDESSLFAGELFRMYTRFAEQKGWKLEVLDLADTEVGGVKYAAFSLEGADVYQFLRFESGVHRVQRIPKTETSGRIHTSTVTVAVLPEAEDVEIEIKPEDLRIDVFRSSGPGGQSVNRTDSAVRVTHIPTGVSVASQKEKSQHRNRDIAMRILRSRLLDQKQAEETAKSDAARRQQVGSGERSERIRTYNFPQNRVSDHRFDLTVYDLSSIIEGNLGELLSQVVALDAEQRLARELRPDGSS